MAAVDRDTGLVIYMLIPGAISAGIGVVPVTDWLEGSGVAVDDGMMILDFNSGDMSPVVTPQPNNGEYRYNDTRCGPAGRLRSTPFTSIRSPNSPTS